MATIKNNPTFNRSNPTGLSKGFHSRTIFNYSVNTATEYDLMQNNASDWCSDGTWDTIGNDLSPQFIHGSNILPPYYWRPGKCIRIIGDLIFSYPILGGISSYEDFLNMRFGIRENNTGSVQLLAAQNATGMHVISNIDLTGNDSVPVHFECTIACGLIVDTSELSFNANGFYQYNLIYNPGMDTTNIATGKAEATIYVPVWGGTADKGFKSVGTDFYNYSTTIIWNGDGSQLGDAYDGYGNAYLSKMVIEELA